MRFDHHEQWILCRLGNRLCGFPSESVREMLALPEIRSVPGSPDCVRGVINLRGKILPIVDLRRRLGMETARDEAEALVALMQQREQDHRNWVAELEASVREKRDFKLTTDPHKCAFGRWYDAYHSENIQVAALLRKFDEPHRNIHRMGIGVLDALSRADMTAVEEILNRGRRLDLARIIGLFEELRATIRDTHRETAVVLAESGSTFAVSVDAVESVERLKEGTIEPLPQIVASTGDRLAGGVGRRTRNDELVLLLDTEKVLDPTGISEDAAAA